MSIGASGRRRLAVVGIGLLMLAGCTSVTPREPSPGTVVPAPLSENEQIAGEILSYLLEVVLGRAGPLENRSAWATRGLDLPLDFDLVYRRMVGPVPLRAELMVLDTNILGLSQVMYHYDRRLNLFKGKRDHDSLFPCAELMAIRLLLLQKLHRREKVGIAALIRHTALFAPGSRQALPEELAAMGLGADELAFLQSVFQSEPAFLKYLRHPFVINTLEKIGLAERDAATAAAETAAGYGWLANQSIADCRSGPLTIAILPAMVAMFTQGPDAGELQPSADYVALREALQTAIVRRVGTATGSAAGRRLSFYAPNRPLTISPANADRVVKALCPLADFTVILLGKNVYRSMVIDPRSDTYPHKNLLYLDVDDVRYDQIDTDIDTIVSALIRPMTG